MALPDPSWRVKTRRCPFYQQGRCLFSDSCNFLHVASATVASEVLYSKPNTNTEPSQSLAQPTTPHRTPEVIINSPASVRSPPRSPRTASLLLALRDVIGDADEEEDNSFTSNEPHSTEDNPWSENLKTLVNADGFGQFSQPDEDTPPEDTHYDPGDLDDDDYEGNWTAISDYSDEEDSYSNSHSSQVDENFLPGQDETHLLDGIEESTVQLSAAVTGNERPLSTESGPIPIIRDQKTTADLTASGLLSPIELSTITFFPVEHDSSRGSNSFDSGYAEHWKPPIPLQSSPPRSPSVNSTFDLLSSPFGTHTSRILSQRLSAFITRSPISPARTVLSPNTNRHDEVESSDISLDSPSVYHSTQGENAPVEEEEANEISSDAQDDENLTQSSLAQQLDLSDNEDDDEYHEEDSFGHTSIWDPEGGPTAVYTGSNSDIDTLVLDDTVKPTSNEPTDPSTSGTQPEIASHSPSPSPTEGKHSITSTRPDSSQLELEEGNSEDDTAFLAYLQSPIAHANENDTLGSFYDIYSDVASEPDSSLPILPARESIQDKPSRSNSSTPSSSLRERVFTPPPPRNSRQRSGTITADSPNSLSSAMTSLDSVSRGRASPLALSDPKSPFTRPGRQSPFAQEVEVSRKVPFGFKNSFSLGKASRSSLMTNRSGKRSVQSSPLQIQTDIPASPSRYSSANHSPTSPTSGLKPLRLSTILNTDNVSRSNFQSRMPLSAQPSVSTFHQSGNSHRHQTSISSSYVSSNNSFSENALLSSTRTSFQPLNDRNSLISSETGTSSPSSTNSFRDLVNHNEPRSAPATSWRQSINYSRPSSRLSQQFYEDDEEDTTRSSSHDPYGETIRRPIPSAPHTAPPYAPAYAIETPKPTLMFAIASDNVDEVKQVLNNGEADPNEAVGPQSALLFALTNDKLANRLDIVKTLLAYGADPSIAKKTVVPQSVLEEEGKAQSSENDDPSRTLMDEVDPATKYYLERADSIHTRRMSVLIQRSFFKPLTRVRYELVGQDRALEQLFRVLSMHSKEYAITPMVVMLCGPSGHGKSLLARKFGSLLDVPTHTVNMTTLRSTHDLWQSYSMSPYEEPTNCTLAEFLINNEGKRCVVVLDEIEKTVDQNTLWSLLMPWELGRCSFEAGSRHVDVKNVIWLGTSNIGHDLVFSHREARKNPEEPMSRREYVELMSLLRPQVSERLGASVLSRITTVLPFVPFSTEEKRAICSEAFYTLGGEFARSLPQERVEGVIESALASFIPAEGARSLSRAISNQLVDII